VFAESAGEGEGRGRLRWSCRGPNNRGSNHRGRAHEPGSGGGDEAHLAQGLCFKSAGGGIIPPRLWETAKRRRIDCWEKKKTSTPSCSTLWLPGKGWFQRGRGTASGAELCSGADADRAQPAGRCVEGIVRRERTIICPSLLICRFCWRGCRGCCGAANGCGRGMRRRMGSPDRIHAVSAIFGTFSFDGKTIDFGTLELRTADNVIHLTLMESETAAPHGAQ